MRTVLLGLGLASMGAACAEDAPCQARFAVRGRWPGERTLSVRIEAESGPVAPDAFRAAIEAALEEWQATGCARFVPAPEDAAPDVTFSWKRAAHGPCFPFGVDPGVAHAGPVAPGTFVHFDAARDWDVELSLRQAALHELGHVLGLDHSADAAAAMFAEPSPTRDRLGASDRAGIHSLYGGGKPGPGDLEVEGALTLHGVAPPELTGWTLFDLDGDGDQEVLVWRTDAAGHGALMGFHFAAGPRLERTLGPLYGLVAPGLVPEFAVTAAGERLVVLAPANAPAQARSFDAHGLPVPFAGALPAERVRAEPLPERTGDLDGDGTDERVRRHAR